MCENNFEKDLQELLNNYTPKPRLRCIGRITHNNYMSGNRLVSQSTFTLLKRKSDLHLTDMVTDDIRESIASLGLSSYDEGLYEIVCIEPSRGYYSCGDEDWELELIPYKEEMDE